MKKIVLLSISLLSTMSCSDFLVQEPVEAISIKDQLSNKQGLLESLNGAYYQLRSNYFKEAVFTYGDLLSGNLKFSPRTSGAVTVASQVDAIYHFDDLKTSSDLESFYSDSYQIINNVNLILQYADQLPDATPSEISEIKAEALSLRAFVHFQLYKYYAQNYTYTSDASHLGIAYNTVPLKVGIDYPVRKTAAETFALLGNDIAQAITYFQPNHAIPAGVKKNFMNATAAKTLAAEISLWKNDWQKAYDYSTDAINGSGLSLTSAGEVAGNWAFSESIFEIANTSTNEFPAYAVYSYKSDTQRSNYVATDDLYNLYAASDNRRSLFETQNIKTNLTTGSSNLPYRFTKKYKGTTTSLIYRLSLLYFIRAEAALHLGNSAQALSDVNTIRNRAGLGSLSAITLDVLLEEKRKEFPFENQYFFDLMRNHKNIVRNNGCISTSCSPTYPNNKFVVPIPQATINVNTGMQQNEGY